MALPCLLPPNSKSCLSYFLMALVKTFQGRTPWTRKPMLGLVYENPKSWETRLHSPLELWKETKANLLM